MRKGERTDELVRAREAAAAPGESPYYRSLAVESPLVIAVDRAHRSFHGADTNAEAAFSRPRTVDWMPPQKRGDPLRHGDRVPAAHLVQTMRRTGDGKIFNLMQKPRMEHLSAFVEYREAFATEHRGEWVGRSSALSVCQSPTRQGMAFRFRRPS